MPRTITLPIEFAFSRVDKTLAQLFPEFSRTQLSVWLRAGKITVNTHTLKPKDKVCAGDVICLHDDLLTQSIVQHNLPEAIGLDIVYEDDAILVINKPAGLVVHPGAGQPNHTLLNALLYHYPLAEQLPRAGIVHRLDKNTTGLMVIAKTLPAYTHLVRQLQARDVKRHYLALVQGEVITGGQINTFYHRHPRNRLKWAVAPHNGKEAITHYRVSQRYQQHTLLDVAILTGRTHQIRVHMAYIHHPIVGDNLYGGRKKVPADMSEPDRLILQQFDRQALHAASLTFEHPSSLTECIFHAALPNDFQALIDCLEPYRVPYTS
tara:strand:+ start:591 stop:1553 length:963 start_codon:yes stop_codon:yes gene_type:complete